MNKHKGFISFVFVFVISSFLPVKTFAATIPPIISYQGKVLENGESVTTTKAMGFLLYDAATGGNLIYTAAGTIASTSTVNITPSQGIFNVDLGGAGTNALTTSTFANYQNLYLEVVVGGHVLSPRKQITSVPYAVNSEYLSGVAARSTSSSSYIPIADDFGNFLFSGNSQSAGVSGGILYINPSSTIPNGTLFGAAVNSVERFRVDTNGNVYASGTLRMAGLSTLTGFLSTASSTVNSTLTVSGLINASSSIFIRNSLTVNPVGPGFDLGRFFVDSSGNVSASGTIKFANLVSCNTIDTDPFGTLVCGNDETGAGGGGSFNGFSSSPFFVTDGSTTSTLRADYFAIATTTARRAGVFSIDTTGNTSASGTLMVYGTTTLRDLTQANGRVLNPRNASFYTDPAGGTYANFVIKGRYLYTVNYNTNTFLIFDISDPKFPRILNTFTTGDQGTTFIAPHDVAVQGSYAYIVSQGDSLVEVVDVSDPRYIRHVGTLLDGQDGADIAGPISILAVGNYAYITTGSSLEVVDISNPRSPKHAGKVALSMGFGNPANSLAISGKFAYVVNDSNSQLVIFDISDPKSPRSVSSLTITGSPSVKGIAVQGQFAYITGQGPNALTIVDVSSSTAPRALATLSHNASGPLLFTPNQVFVSGDYAYVASGGSNALEIIDITSSTAPVHVSSLTNGTTGASLLSPTAVKVQGNYAYLSASNGTLDIVDISGVSISNTNIGTAKIANLETLNDVYIGGSLSIKNGLYVGNNGLAVNGDLSLNSPTTSLSATNTLSFSNKAYFIASSSQGNNFIFDATNTPASASTNYLFSVRNRSTKMFSISTNGDVRATGAYFGSSATVGTPGAPGDLAERVDVAISEEVTPGDVMTINQNSTDTYEKTSSAYQSGVAGVISTNPTIVVGNGVTEHTAAMAMIGRVPLHVSLENGPIHRGDILVSASIPGFAMKYDAASAPQNVMIGVVGEALDEFTSGSSSTGTIMALIRTGYINTNRNVTQTNTSLQTLSVSENSSGAITFPANQDINFSGNALINIARLQSENNLWEITKDGELISHVTTNDGVLDLYGAVGARSQYILSGSGTLSGGVAHISFSPLEAAGFDATEPIQVTVTLTGASDANSLRVVSKDATGFTVQEQSAGTSQASFDWIVIGSRKKIGNLDSAPLDISSPMPAQEEVTPTESAPVNEQSPEINSATVQEESPSVSEPPSELTTESAPTDAPTPSEPPQTESAPADQTVTP